MAYLGRKGATAPLTSADIPDDSITGAKIVDDAIDSEHYAAGSVDAAHVAADVATQAEIDLKAPLAAPTFSGVTTAASLVLTPGSAPATTEGAIYYDSTADVVKIRNASRWNTISSGLPTSTSTNATVTYYSSGGHDYVTYTFLTSGTFTPTAIFEIDYLVVAGGGGGGRQIAGGGGAGGYRTATGLSLTATAYTITVGAGGIGSTDSGLENATQGGPSSIAGSGITTVTATGGGLGSSYDASGGTGGSGGGAGIYSQTGGTGIYDGGTIGSATWQGRDGGDSSSSSPSGAGGGGGGASAEGTDAATDNGGAGGAGTANSYRTGWL